MHNFLVALAIWVGMAAGAVVLFLYLNFVYIRRPVRHTLTVSSSSGLRRGMLLRLDSANAMGELVIVRRVLDGRTVAIEPCTGWRKWANRTRMYWHFRYRALKDRIYGWFEKDEDDDD